MEKLSIKDVSKRRRALENKRKRKNISLLLDKEKLTLKEAQEVIENFESIHENQVYAFEKVLEIFKESYMNNYTCKNDLELKRLCNTICGIMHNFTKYRSAAPERLRCSVPEYIMIDVKSNGYLKDDNGVMYPLQNVVSIYWNKDDEIHDVKLNDKYAIFFDKPIDK